MERFEKYRVINIGVNVYEYIKELIILSAISTLVLCSVAGTSGISIKYISLLIFNSCAFKIVMEIYKIYCMPRYIMIYRDELYVSVGHRERIKHLRNSRKWELLYRGELLEERINREEYGVIRLKSNKGVDELIYFEECLV